MKLSPVEPLEGDDEHPEQTEQEKKFAALEGRIHKITSQGRLLKWRVEKSKYKLPPCGIVGRVAGFSAQARKRLLEYMATIRYAENAPGYFVSLTYPDDKIPKGKDAFNKQRFKFWRYLERERSIGVCGIWRLEWKPRQTGRWVGCLAPHFHLMIFGCVNLDEDYIRSVWKRSIGDSRWISVDCQMMLSEKQCGTYVAKYCAKNSPLDSIPNLNKLYFGGRAWGRHMKELIVRHEVQEWNLTTVDFLDGIYEYGASSVPMASRGNNHSFTVFGDIAIEIGELIEQNYIDYQFGVQ